MKYILAGGFLSLSGGLWFVSFGGHNIGSAGSWLIGLYSVLVRMVNYFSIANLVAFIEMLIPMVLIGVGIAFIFVGLFQKQAE